MKERVIPLENCPNFRDLAGYTTVGGEQIRGNRLFRSSHLANLTDLELQQLEQLKIASVFDLRRESERDHYPNRLGDSMKAYEFQIDVGSTKHFFEALVSGTATPERTHGMMVSSYAKYVDDLRREFGEIFKLLANDDDQAVLFHCMVGKDRTGITIALILKALGVPEATIIDDYLLSNRYYPAERIQALLMGYLRQAGVHSMDEETMKPFCSVHADYLKAAFAAIDEKHGGIDSYLKEYLEIDENVLMGVRKRFLTA